MDPFIIESMELVRMSNLRTYIDSPVDISCHIFTSATL